MKIEPHGNGAWFLERKGNRFSLGVVLTSICGLLASPEIVDPLVQEIAEKYISDYGGYCAAAKLYASRYATGVRPTDDEIIFAEEKEEVDRRYAEDQELSDEVQAYHNLGLAGDGRGVFGESSSSQNAILWDGSSGSQETGDLVSSVSGSRTTKCRLLPTYLQKLLRGSVERDGNPDGVDNTETTTSKETDTSLDQRAPDVYLSLKLVRRPPPEQEFMNLIDLTRGMAIIIRPRPRLVHFPTHWISDNDDCEFLDSNHQATWCGACGKWCRASVPSEAWLESHMRKGHRVELNMDDDAESKKMLPEPEKIWRSHEGHDFWNAQCGECKELLHSILRRNFAHKLVCACQMGMWPSLEPFALLLL
jgi:hypothetical protein